MSLSHRTWPLASICLAGWWLLLYGQSQAQPRIAIVPFNGEISATQQLQTLAAASEFPLVDQDQLQIALQAVAYQGSLNLSLDEARALGLSIGCDQYLLGSARIQRRLLSVTSVYFDVMVAAFVVDTQTGKLKQFLFEATRSETEALAQTVLHRLIQKIWRQATDAIKSNVQSDETGHHIESYDLSTVDAAQLELTPPQFFRRLKPVYSEQAALSGVAATVELKATFLADGKMGKIELLRWAGFGLDEAALATARQLKFEPAKIKGKVVNVQAVIQYNFRKEEKAK